MHRSLITKKCLDLRDNFECVLMMQKLGLAMEVCQTIYTHTHIYIYIYLYFNRIYLYYYHTQNIFMYSCHNIYITLFLVDQNKNIYSCVNNSKSIFLLNILYLFSNFFIEYIFWSLVRQTLFLTFFYKKRIKM